MSAKIPGRRTTPIITAFERSPDRGRGLARDMRVRWALEEVGQPYDVRLLSFGAMKEPAHLALHPFGQIPTYEVGELALFETGAIVLHIAEHHTGLLPDDANARARAIMWMFAALGTVEPPIVEREMAMILERDEVWYEQRLHGLEKNVRKRLGELSARLGDADVLWVLGSALLLLGPWISPSALGWALIVVQALIVALLAALESAALGRSPATQAIR